MTKKIINTINKKLDEIENQLKERQNISPMKKELLKQLEEIPDKESMEAARIKVMLYLVNGGKFTDIVRRAYEYEQQEKELHNG